MQEEHLLMRLLNALRKRGDYAVTHGLLGKPSNRRIEEDVEKASVKILSGEYLANKHGIEASNETVRQRTIRGKQWKAKTEKVKAVHFWRPRRSRSGELVQSDISEHDWLEGRGEELYLIAMIAGVISRLFARFVRHGTTTENLKRRRALRELGITWIPAHSPRPKGGWIGSSGQPSSSNK